MRFCTSCGHELGVGRFCTNCGHPVDRSASRPPDPALGEDQVATTAERRAARRSAALESQPPRTPPAAADTPPAPRFPLFADEVGPEFTTRVAAAGHRTDGDPTLGGATTDTTDGLSPVADDASGGAHRLGESSASHRWDTGTVVGGSEIDRGTSLLDRFGASRADEGPQRPAPGGRTPDEALAALNAAAGAHETENLLGRRRRGPWLVGALLLVLVAAALVAWLATRGGDDETATDRASTGDTSSSAEARDFAAEATAETPGNARPATEVGGGKATFVAENLLDGDPATAWRTGGDATGEEIVLTLPAETTISEVGLVNGYAKVGTDADGTTFDWYHGNRTITEVAWLFDDETVVNQTLERDRQLQTVEIDDVTTTTITLRILGVTEPGTGRASRDFTAISDVSLTGVPGG